MIALDEARVMTNAPTSGRPLPEGWRWARLGDHVTKIGSGATPSGGQASYSQSGIPLIRSQNVHMNHFIPTGLAYISHELDEEMKGSRVLTGDVLLNITGASIGRVCVVPTEFCPGNVNQHVSIVRSDGAFDPSFLSYYLSNPDFQSHILANQAGATRQALTKAQIENFQIPFPPLAAQRRIAAILTEQMAVVERARAAAEAQLAAARELPAAYLRSVFNGSDERGWPTERLDNNCALLPSKSIATDGDSEVQAITTASLTEAGFNPSGVKVGRMWASDAVQCVVAPGEILIARSNTPELVGRVAVFAGVPHGAVASDLTIRIRPGPDLLPTFLGAYLSFLYLDGYWKERAGGASGSMKKITRSQVQELSIPVPPIEEQRRIAASLKEGMDSSKQIRGTLQEQLDAISKLPAALLKQAFNGAL